MYRPAVWMFVILCAAGCDGFTTVRGRVVDAAGKPVSGAAVRFQRLGSNPPPAAEAQTDKAGGFSVTRAHAPFGKVEFTLSVSMPGYRPHREVITSEIPNRQVTVVLDSEPR